MATVTKTLPGSLGAPLMCNCNGSAVWIVLTPDNEHYSVKGFFDATITSKHQLVDGRWVYYFDVPDWQIVGGPLPADIVWSVACSGCAGIVMRKLFAIAAHDEFNRVVLGVFHDIAVGTYHVGFMPRPFRICEGIRVSWPVAGVAPTGGHPNRGYFSIALLAGGVNLLTPSPIRIDWSQNTTVIPMANISTAGKATIAGGTRLTCVISGISDDGGYAVARGLEIAYRGVWQP